jgi:hypothetical protein
MVLEWPIREGDNPVSEKLLALDSVVVAGSWVSVVGTVVAMEAPVVVGVGAKVDELLTPFTDC